MKSESDPQQGADLLMYIKVRPEEAEMGLNHNIKLLHTEPCIICGGRGQIQDEKCHNCHGSGHKRVKRTIEIHIPSGVKNGMRLRLKGLGEAGDYGAENGNLFIEVNIRSDNQSIIKCIVTKLKNLLLEGEVIEYSPIKIPHKISEEKSIESTPPKTDDDIPHSNESENVSKDEDKSNNSDFDLNVLKENIKKYHETHPEENSETIKKENLEFSNYTENKNILISMKLSYYSDKKCCASCWFCYISPVRTHNCVKHNFKNNLNGFCDDYTYHKIQLQDI
jgi:hypothetical protein